MTIAVQKIAVTQFNKLILEHPEQEVPGGCVFLGKHFAKNHILHLGINPGGDMSGAAFSTGLLSDNPLLAHGSDRSDRARVRYWNCAADVLTANPHLKKLFESATYSFCCPYRTKQWGGKELPAKKRRTLLHHSKPILEAILDEGHFNTIVATGVNAKNILIWNFRDLFSSISETQKPIKRSNIMQWSTHSLIYKGRAIKIIQIPHYSRSYGNQHWSECSDWLAKQLAA